MIVARPGVSRLSIRGGGFWPAQGRWNLTRTQKRWITVSVMPNTKVSRYFRFKEQLLESYDESDLRFAWPDLPGSTISGTDSMIEAAMNGEQLFSKKMELSVIVSAANPEGLLMSDKEYRYFLRQKIDLWRATGAGSLSSLVVKGSQPDAYAELDLQKKVDERYMQACQILRDEGIELWLVADLYGESKYVLNSLDFKLAQQPSCIVVQPIKHWAGVTRETRDGLARRFQKLGGILQLVQLEELQVLIDNHRRKQESKQVGDAGRDLYVYDPDVPGLVENLGKERVEELNVGIARQVLGPFLRSGKPNDYWWTRVGMGMDIAFAKRLAIMDRMQPVFEVDASDPEVYERALAYFNRSNRGFSDAELREWLIQEQLRTNYDFKALSLD